LPGIIGIISYGFKQPRHRSIVRCLKQASFGTIAFEIVEASEEVDIGCNHTVDLHRQPDSSDFWMIFRLRRGGGLRRFGGIFFRKAIVAGGSRFHEVDR
jgi:hypothetical protein